MLNVSLSRPQWQDALVDDALVDDALVSFNRLSSSTRSRRTCPSRYPNIFPTVDLTGLTRDAFKAILNYFLLQQ